MAETAPPHWSFYPDFETRQRQRTRRRLRRVRLFTFIPAEKGILDESRELRLKRRRLAEKSLRADRDL